MFKKFLLSGSLLLAAQINGQAQIIVSADTTDENETVARSKRDSISTSKLLEPVEIRSIRASSDAPFAKTDLNKKEIERQNMGQDIPYLLQYTPSVVTNSDAGTGIGYTGIHIRGVDPTRINVTFNGIPVNDPEEQATFFVDIPDIASSTNSIQVQRGVGTSTNGAGAFGATISISNLAQADTASATFSSSAGTFNTWKNTLAAGTGMLRGGWQMDVRMSKINSDGYIQRAFTDLKSMQFIAGYTPDARTSFHFLFMTGEEKTGQAWDGVPQDSLATNRTYNDLGLKPDGTYYSNQTDNYMQNYYQLFADHSFSSAFTAHGGLFLTRGVGYYEEYKQGADYAAYGLNYPISALGDTTYQTDLIRRLYLDNYYYGGVFSLLYTGNKSHLTLGGGWTQFENQHYGKVIWTQNGGVPENYEWYRHDAQKNDLNVYLKADKTFGKLILFGDMQYRNVALYINGFQDNPLLKPTANYDFYNPKAGLTYLIKNTMAMHEKIYASFAMGNREPNSSDFEIGVVNQPKPETLYDYEAGYEMARRKWNLGANLYYMYYHNQLVLTGQINDVGAYTQTNVASSYRAGIELQGGVEVAKWLRVMGNATLSQNKVKDFTEYIDNYDTSVQSTVKHSNTNIAFSPSLISAFTFAFTPIHTAKGHVLEADITGKFVGKQYLDNTGNEDRVIKQYSFCNVMLRYTTHLRPFKEVSLALALNNVFGQLYSNNGYTYSYISGGLLNTSNAYFPQAGFNMLGGITLRW